MFSTTYSCFVYSTLLITFVGLAKCDFLEDYCWRDYDDVIPSDALIAGTARDGSPIYIGQVLYDDKLIPGKIHHNSSQIHIEFQRVHVLNETIKILCTTHPKKFVWINATTDNILDMKDKHIFEGGYEKGVITYIGRAVSHDELTIGKVICWTNSHCIRLTTIEAGKWYSHSSFEILTFVDDAEPATDTVPIKQAYTDNRDHRGVTFWPAFLLVMAVIGLSVVAVLLIRRC